MVKFIRYIFAFWLSIFICSSFAALDIELTQGVNEAIPIGVASFSDGLEVSDVISSDLKNSGRFQIIAWGDETDYSDWRRKKADYAIIGNVKFAGLFKRKVSFQLLDIYNKFVLLNKQYIVTRKQFRFLAHYISDLIYQQLTGDHGIFFTKIAYVLVQRSNQKMKYSLMVSDADGYNPKPLVISNQPIMSPAWSPDGKKIAYVSFEDQRAAIYMQKVASGERELISEYPGINGAPAWSPDGSKLALVLTRTGYPKIYIFNLATSKLQQITQGMSLDTEPAWSPDGKSIIFTSNRGGSPQLYQLFFKNMNIQRVTYAGDYNARASFTPNGRSIVMLTREDGLFNIATQDLNTGRVNILTKLGKAESPSIAPNGKMVVYAIDYGGQKILGEVSIDGNIKLRLPAEEGDVQEPAWSPFLNRKF